MSRNDKMKFIRLIEGSQLSVSDALGGYMMFLEALTTAGSEG